MANYDSTHTGATIDSAVSQVTDSTTDFNVDSNTLVVDKSANSVGIGTDSPSQQLDIKQSVVGNLTARVYNESNSNLTDHARILITSGGTSGGDAFLNIGISSGDAYSVGVDNDDSDKFKISKGSALGTDDRFVIDTSGNVGIGNAAPTALLTVGAITTLVTDGTTAVTPEGVNVHITEASKYAMGIKNADASGDGLIIQAGDASDDYALRVENYDSGNDLFVITGGGS